MNIYEAFFSELNKAKIKYLVVGGLAVNFHGYLRATADIDVLLSLKKDNLKKMNELMTKLGYSPRLPVDVKELSNKKQLKEWMQNKNLKAYTYNPPKEAILQIDIVIEESLNFDEIYTRKMIKEINKTQIYIVSLEDLIKMKKRAGREKDLLDLKVLLDLRKE